MSPRLREIQTLASRLPAEERAQLVEALLASLQEMEPLLEPEWREEVGRRLAKWEAEPSSASDASEVFAAAR